ncbi:hypothetical protein BDQ17DRAFT_1350147 [Cyathus striatus]|nr:hypothetical protein BDQ17DRAFT_1350147 [Cyathus striatus]
MPVAYIWASPHWSVIKVLYIFVRYSTFVDAILNVLVQCSPALTSEKCKVLYRAITTLAVILTLRVWAVWKRTLWICDGLLLNSLGFELQSAFHFVGCLVTHGNIVLEAITWGILLGYDTVMMVLMLPIAFRALKMGGRSTLANAVIRDGVIFYIFLFAISLVNMVALLTLTPDYFALLAAIGRVIHSALSCRVVLHAREQGWNTSRVHSTTITGI